MTQLQRVNDLHLWDFEVHASEDGVVRILGSNDFTYYHDLEIEFRGVTFTDLPPRFSHAQFRLGSDGGTVWVTVDDGEFEIQFAEMAVRVAKVFYYER